MGMGSSRNDLSLFSIKNPNQRYNAVTVFLTRCFTKSIIRHHVRMLFMLVIPENSVAPAVKGAISPPPIMLHASKQFQLFGGQYRPHGVLFGNSH
jgi:hypothetical protein